MALTSGENDMTEENRERTREMIKLMQAYLDGEVVELYFNGTWTRRDQLG